MTTMWCIATASGKEVADGNLQILLDSVGVQARVVLVVREALDGQVAVLRAHPSVASLVCCGRAGVSAARNIGLLRLRQLRPSATDWVSFPDDDCFHYPSLAERVCAQSEDVDFLLGSYGERPESTGPRQPLSWSLGLRRGCSVGIYARWGLVLKVGLFNEGVGVGSAGFQYGEDGDYVLRALARSVNPVYDPSVRVFHAEQRPTGSRNPKGHLTMAALQERNLRLAILFMRGFLSAPVQDLLSRRPPWKCVAVGRALRPKKMAIALRGKAEARERWRNDVEAAMD